MNESKVLTEASFQTAGQETRSCVFAETVFVMEALYTKSKGSHYRGEGSSNCPRLKLTLFSIMASKYEGIDWRKETIYKIPTWAIIELLHCS